MNMGHLLGTLIIGLLILVVLLLLLREFVCWYWKINQHGALLTEIRDLLATSQNAVINSAKAANSGGSAADGLVVVQGAAGKSQARAQQDDSAIRQLAEKVRDQPRLPIDEKIEFLQRVGGAFAWEKGSSCRVRYKGQEHAFPGGKEFGDWLSSNVVADVLASAGS